MAGDDLLELLSPDDRDALLAAGSVRRLDARQAVVHEGDEAREVLIVVTGSVKVTRTSVEGREVVVGVRTPGELIGEVGAIDGGRRSASIWTLEPTELRAVPTTTFKAMLLDRPSMAVAMLEVLSQRLRESTNQVLELGTMDALARVSRRLLELAPSATAPAAPLGISQQDLAARCGLSREAVVKAMRTLRTVGWIRQDGRSIELVDVAALRERAGLAA
jgi:CRP-like cAMP-binding protein